MGAAYVSANVRALERAIHDVHRRDALRSLWQLLRAKGLADPDGRERRDALSPPSGRDRAAERSTQHMF
jgi:hypothetical protein